MSKRESKFLKKQKLALSVIGVVVIAVAVYLFTIVISDTVEGEFVEGEHFFAIEKPRRVRGDKIEVMEFFSYGCIHCYNFDDDLTEWANDRSSQVALVRTPVIANDLWRNLGRAHYGLMELGILDQNHVRLFKEIHDGKRNLNTLEKIAAILATSEVSEEELLAAFTSEQVTQKVNRADNLARRFKIASVPNLVVNGKYRVSASRDVGLIKMLDVMDFLIEQETELKTNPSAG